MNTKQLLDLASRCEREEPSRKLDAEIYAAISAWPPDSEIICGDDGSIVVYHGDAKALDECRHRYTTSLDAAVTLVPEGLWREQDGPRPYTKIPSVAPNVWRCRITQFWPFADSIGWGSTEALALCVAALKARAAITEQEAHTSTKERT